MDDFSPVRRQYVELIRQRANLRSERLACALSEVPREDYLGPAVEDHAVRLPAEVRGYARRGAAGWHVEQVNVRKHALCFRLS